MKNNLAHAMCWRCCAPTFARCIRLVAQGSGVWSVDGVGGIGARPVCACVGTVGVGLLLACARALLVRTCLATGATWWEDFRCLIAW